MFGSPPATARNPAKVMVGKWHILWWASVSSCVSCCLRVSFMLTQSASSKKKKNPKEQGSDGHGPRYRAQLLLYQPRIMPRGRERQHAMLPAKKSKTPPIPPKMPCIAIMTGISHKAPTPYMLVVNPIPCHPISSHRTPCTPPVQPSLICPGRSRNSAPNFSTTGNTSNRLNLPVGLPTSPAPGPGPSSNNA